MYTRVKSLLVHIEPYSGGTRVLPEYTRVGINTCYGIGAQFSFSSSPLWDLKDLSQKPTTRKAKLIPDKNEKSHGLVAIQPKSCRKITKFRRFRVKEPRHSENVFAKKRYTSIVERDSSGYPQSTYPGTKPSCSGQVILG